MKERRGGVREQQGTAQIYKDVLMCSVPGEIQYNGLSYSCSSTLELKDAEFEFHPQFAFQLNYLLIAEAAEMTSCPIKRQIKSVRL